MNDVRCTTNALIGIVEDSRDFNFAVDVLVAALKYMSEDEVADMCRLNEFDVTESDNDE